MLEKNGAAKMNNQTTRINAEVNAGIPIGSKLEDSAANTKEVTITANIPYIAVDLFMRKTPPANTIAVNTLLNPKAPARIAGSAAPIPHAIKAPSSDPKSAAMQAVRELINKPIVKNIPVIILHWKNTCDIPLNIP